MDCSIRTSSDSGTGTNALDSVRSCGCCFASLHLNREDARNESSRRRTDLFGRFFLQKV